MTPVMVIPGRYDRSNVPQVTRLTVEQAEKGLYCGYPVKPLICER